MADRSLLGAFALSLGLALAAGLPMASLASAKSWPPDPYPALTRVENAQEFAAGSSGTVAFAVIDADGGLRGFDEDDPFSSASVSKALLVAAELRRLRADHERLDEGTRSLLEAMIRFSDNDAASSIYARVGDEGMEEVARAAGMESFEVTPGYWGGAQVTAADLARFFYRLDENLVGPDRAYGKNLFATISESQLWGIPSAADREWHVYFKGGWRPPATEETSGPVTHQAALLRHRSGRKIAIAVLTDQSPGSGSYEILEGITERLLVEPPAAQRWPAG